MATEDWDGSIRRWWSQSSLWTGSMSEFIRFNWCLLCPRWSVYVQNESNGSSKTKCPPYHAFAVRFVAGQRFDPFGSQQRGRGNHAMSGVFDVGAGWDKGKYQSTEGSPSISTWCTHVNVAWGVLGQQWVHRVDVEGVTKWMTLKFHSYVTSVTS